jgi:hypothetical protein
MYFTQFAEVNMWLAIIYVCFSGTQVRCDFVTATLPTKMECLKTLSQVVPVLQLDDEVLMYDKKCIQLSTV